MTIRCVCEVVLTLLFLCSLSFLIMFCIEKERQVGMIIFLSIMTAISIILIIVFATIVINQPQVVGTIIPLE